MRVGINIEAPICRLRRVGRMGRWEDTTYGSDMLRWKENVPMEIHT